ncbi:MAG: hypothetical protein QXJ02_05005, partial [Candidatus Bathyarchaeia archaeon]
MSKEENKPPATAEPQKSSFISQILKVLYAPTKAFSEIKETPKYVGPLLILILFIAANTTFLYVFASKLYVEQTMPTADQLDMWTENATLWTAAPDVAITENFADFINGSYYGNRSIAFSTNNSAYISALLEDIGPVNCQNSTGFTNMFLRMKVTTVATIPQNMSFFLLSPNTSSYFSYDAAELLANFTLNAWNNLTLVFEENKWTPNGVDANWSSITGLRLELSWLENENITLLIDGLFFKGTFKSVSEIMGSNVVLNFTIISLTRFIIQWAFLAAILFFLSKALGSTSPWKPLLIAVGFALITLFIQAAANAALYSTLPRINYTFDYLGSVEGEGKATFERIMEEIGSIDLISSLIQLA